MGFGVLECADWPEFKCNRCEGKGHVDPSTDKEILYKEIEKLARDNERLKKENEKITKDYVELVRFVYYE